MKFDCNMYIHPTQARGLTPREAARVQSYPDDYYFRGAYTKTYMQVVEYKLEDSSLNSKRCSKQKEPAHL